MNRRETTREGNELARHESAPGSPRDSAPRLNRFRGWRGWALRLLLVFLGPVLFLGLIEAGMRAVGYGYPTGFFVKIAGQSGFRTNDRFGWRFFPRALSRWPEIGRAHV